MKSAIDFRGIEESDDLVAHPIDVLQLSVRARNCLTNRGIATIGELIKLTDVELLAIANLGRRTLGEIRSAVAGIELRMGMRGDESPDELAISSFPSLPPRGGAPEIATDDSVDPLRPAEAVRNLLSQFRSRELAVLRHRIIDCDLTLEALGTQFGVTRERIRQIERRLRERLRGSMAAPKGQWARDLRREVRTRLGSAAPIESVSQYLLDLCAFEESPEDRGIITGFILWIAGPYETDGEWKMTDPQMAALTRESLLDSRDGRGWLCPEREAQTLERAGIRPEYHAEWMRWVGFIEADGGWLPRLANIPDRVEQLLLYRGVPVTAEELAPLVECESERSLRSRLLEDERFKRISRQSHFALRQWSQYDEYTGIADEIAEEIARQGGVADALHLIEVITQRYGVKASSVHQYLSAPMFIKLPQGQVRRRTVDEALTVRPDPRFCAGLYCVNDQWLLRMKITGETMRGSGRSVNPAVSVLMGCQPGERRVIKSPRDAIVISWPQGSACGPNLGSLRPDVEALGGAIDDYVFLTLGGAEIDVRLLRAREIQDLSNDMRLALLIGLSRSTPDEGRLEAIASAIGLRSELPVTPEDLHACLMRRNEVPLARLIDLPDLKDPDGIFAHLERTLWG
jgi:hypothetical protein